MGNGRLNNWRWWLQIVSLGLLSVATFAPVSETLRGIFLPLGLAGTLVHLATDPAESWKWLLRSLIALAAVLLIADLFSFSRGLTFAGVLSAWAGILLWEVFEAEHAEYLARRDRRDSVSSPSARSPG